MVQYSACHWSSPFPSIQKFYKKASIFSEPIFKIFIIFIHILEYFQLEDGNPGFLDQWDGRLLGLLFTNQ